jgi:hypothetical protein
MLLPDEGIGRHAKERLIIVRPERPKLDDFPDKSGLSIE